MLHNNKSSKMTKLFKELQNKQFIVEYTKKHVKIIHESSQQHYTYHESRKGYHPLRRWLKSNFDIIFS